MWIYFAVITLIVLNCIGFYENKIMIWSVPVGLIAIGLCTIFCQYFMSKCSNSHEVMSGNEIKLVCYYISQFLVISVVCSSITILIRYKKNKNALSKSQNTKEAE